MFAFHDDVTLVSCVPKTNRAAIASSAEHSDSKVGNEVSHTTDVIVHYNATEGGINTVVRW
jgi:hypothetical protein